MHRRVSALQQIETYKLHSSNINEEWSMAFHVAKQIRIERKKQECLATK